MTKINRIVMRGFKSFANKTEIEFGETFNCVLGPNGSGKSNIMDAICFVLGKGSAKGLRVEKAANLIYNGGKSKKSAKEGEVAIFFDNSENTFPTEEKEIKISRIIKQSGQSVYKINDKTRTRQQILELLSIAKIEPDGYNIILQGDIVSFVELSGEKRRHIIEEIAGISIYEEKKTKTLRELDNVQEKLKNADLILVERRTHLQELKKDRDHALKYKELSEKKDSNKATLLHLQIEKKTSTKDKLQGQIDDLQKNKAKFQEEIQQVRKDISAKKSEIDDISKEIERRGEKEQVKVHKEVETLRIDIATNKTRISSLENEIQRVDQRKAQLLKTVSEIDQKIEKLYSEAKAFETKKEKAHADLAGVEKRISDFRKNHKLDAAGDIERKIDEIDKKADDKQQEIQKLREKQQELLREKDRQEMQIESVDEKISKVNEVTKEHKKEIEELKNKKALFKEKTLKLSKLQNEDAQLASQLSNARSSLLSQKEQLEKKRLEHSALKDKVSFSTAVTKVLENKKTLQGVYDTVAKLGKVQSRYALAMDVAAGPRLTSIVVDNEDVAKKSIEYLRSNRLGVATFLPLTKIRPKKVDPSIKNLTQANGVEGLAQDLITYDSKFNNVFSYVFGGTLIVKDLNAAKRIGIGTIRMVTLEGDLVELSGAMQGGFRQRKRAIGFSEKEVEADLNKLEESISQKDSVVRKLENQREELESSISKLREEKAALEGDIIKSEKSLHLDTSDLESSREVKKEFQAKLKEADKELTKVQTKIAEMNKELAQLKINRQSLRSEVNELHNPRLLAELNTFEQKREDLKETIGKIDVEIKSLNVQKKNILEPERVNTQKILSQHEKEEKKFTEEIRDLKSKIKDQESELKEKEKIEKKFYAQFKDLFNKRNKVNDQVNKLESKLTQKEASLQGFGEKINAISLDNARITAELSALEEEFKPLKDAKLVKNKSEEDLKKEISQLERMTEQLGGINMRALEIYEKVETEYNKLIEKKDKLIEEKEDILVMINEIETKKKDLFMKTFNAVQENFQSVFNQLTTKGQAEMTLENPDQPFDGGLDIRVRMSTRKFLDIRSLSGGEKTLAALAFIFSIQDHDPASFYILDEVDAALDKRNSELLSKLVHKYSKHAQYILISHNDGVISEADTLYGVSMNEHGMSKVVSLKV